MKNVVRETLRELSHESPAVPLAVLVARLRARGTPVTEAVLLRTLEQRESGAHLVDPWQGPLSSLGPVLAGEGAAPGPWVVLDEDDDEDDPDPDPSAPAALRRILSRSLRRLGRTVDTRSPGDLARWMAMVEEARRLPPAA
ncbi:MAG: hypothetical protein RQ751_04905 [Longimicrobiales bacterium]|nr:hypothetical protein [Longimicrobiales bacterium]